MRADRVLWLACLGYMYFFFLGALLKMGIFDYGPDVLKVDPVHTARLYAALAVGIGLGSFAAGYLSGGKIEYGLVPLGALGLSVFACWLWQPGLPYLQLLLLFGALGFFGGFFIVPVSAILQHRPAKGQKGAVLGAASLLSWVGIIIAAVFYFLLVTVLKLGPQSAFLLGGLLTLAATIYVVWLLPDSLLRFVLWVLTHTVYRIRVDGRDNIPSKGGALFVSNHLSLVDALLLLASTDRHIRFIMYKGIYEQPWIKPFARILRAIPISSELRPREMLQALRTASEAIQNGEVVCIFAEGQITRPFAKLKMLPQTPCRWIGMIGASVPRTMYSKPRRKGSNMPVRVSWPSAKMQTTSPFRMASLAVRRAWSISRGRSSEEIGMERRMRAKGFIQGCS